MKGFLSLLGITLIVGAFGLILFSFYGNPLEELKSQERMYAYNETRQNHSAAEMNFTNDFIDAAIAAPLYMESDLSCERPK